MNKFRGDVLFMDDKFNYWVNQYHDTDKEVYREIIFS